jgi:mxaJ protein
VQEAGDDYHNPLEAQALAPRHLAGRLRSYPLDGNWSSTKSEGTVVDAVAAGQLDVAVVWGPLAGYLAARERVPLVIAPVQARQGRDVVPFAFDMSVGVRSEDVPLHAALDAAIGRRSAEIHQILRRFGVPLVTGT